MIIGRVCYNRSIKPKDVNAIRMSDDQINLPTSIASIDYSHRLEDIISAIASRTATNASHLYERHEIFSINTFHLTNILHTTACDAYMSIPPTITRCLSLFVLMTEVHENDLRLQAATAKVPGAI